MTNKTKIILFFLITFIVVIYLFLNAKSRNNQQITNPVKQLFIKNIIPGITTKEEIIQGFGDPIASNEGTLEYKSKSPVRNNEIKIQSDKVLFVKEIISYGDKISFNSETNQYSDIKFLYGPDAVNGYLLYCIPEKGIAYLANPNSDAILEIWHYPATTFTDFKNTWAKDYSETPIKNQF